MATQPGANDTEVSTPRHGEGAHVVPLATLVGLPRTERLVRLAACRRRQTPEAAESTALARYKELVAQGRRTPEKRQLWYDKLCWWSAATTRAGSQIFVVAPRGPQGETDLWIHMWELLAYAADKMHDHVVVEDKPFAVVWGQFNDHRMWLLSMWRFKGWLHPKFAKNLEAVHVVHPSWTMRLLSLVLWPLAEDEFWNYFHCHERIEFLAEFMDLRAFRLPKDLYEYDKFLDKQAAEMSEHNQNRMAPMGMMGGSLPGTSAEDREKQAERLEELKRLLAEKGYQNKED